MGLWDILAKAGDWFGDYSNSDAWNLLDQNAGGGLTPDEAFANYGYSPEPAYSEDWATRGGASTYNPDTYGGGSATPDTGIDWSKWVGPAVGAGTTLLGSAMQGSTAGKTNAANRAAYATEEAARQGAYQQYLDNLNPPESVRNSRQAQLQAEVEAKAPEMTRRTRDVLAEHGVRGRGKASAVAQTQSKLDEARNQAYWLTHGNFATPGSPRQTTNVPATPDLGMADFLGKNLSDLGSAWFAYSYAPEYLKRKY